jgi:hypothetical protein
MGDIVSIGFDDYICTTVKIETYYLREFTISVYVHVRTYLYNYFTFKIINKYFG